jgi:two-component system, cell cycle response regulator DivK
MAGELILVVDDSAPSRRLLRIVLERRGYRALEAAGADAARAAVAREKPRLVLMDVEMPGVDGLQLTREFKSDERMRDVPVIAVTSLAAEGDEERCLAAGCDAYLTKPVDVPELLASIRKLLG